MCNINKHIVPWDPVIGTKPVIISCQKFSIKTMLCLTHPAANPRSMKAFRTNSSTGLIVGRCR